MRPVPPTAIDLIRQFEGCRITIYPDSVGLPTIGIGHLIRPVEDFSAGITTEQAEDILKQDLAITVRAVKRLIQRKLTDNQYAALLSFTFNAGAGSLQRSTLRQKCNRGEDGAVPAEFLKWCRAGGKVSRGLLRRRQAEAELYGDGVGRN